MMRSLIAGLCSLMLIASAMRASAQPPASVAVDGVLAIPLAGHAHRVHLLGTIDLYTIAMYVNGSLRDDAQLSSPQVAKAIRIEVTYEDDLHRKIAVDWRNELVPRLEAPAVAHLRGAFAPIRRGDVVLIEYAPAKGTTVRINKGVAVSGGDHDLFLAFLDNWLGQRPISEEMKQTLRTSK